MRPRSSILLGLLIVLLVAPLASGAPEFDTYLPNSITLNPNDGRITTFQAKVEGVVSPVRIKELTLRNLGNASSNELDEILLQYRKRGEDWDSLTLDNLSGINSGITFSLPGEGMTLGSSDVGEFRFLVDVAGSERIPVSRYGENIYLQLSGMFHYVYLEDGGEAVESVSSRWVTDPGVDEILRGGFEGIEALPLEDDILQPGATTRIGRYVFRDRDSNRDGVEVDLIKVENRSDVDEPVILGEDITELTLNLRIHEGDEVTEKTISRKVNSPTTEVTFPTEPGGWWNGRCGDGCEVELGVDAKISGSGPVQGMELRTGVTMETKENNGTSGFPFRQRSIVPEESAQSVVVQGLEEIEETTDWRSGVINQGETYTQQLVLSDEDRDNEDFMVESVSFRNEGTLDSNYVSGVTVYRVESGGSLERIPAGLNFSSDWQNLHAGNRRVPDDGRGVFEIHYQIAEDATANSTFQPAVQFRGSEGPAENAPSPVHRSPEELTIYPYGAEIVEASGGSMARSPISGTEGIIGQRIDVMDRDENRLDLLINPIVIKNRGTATGSDFRKLELYDSDGDLLVTKTDLSGLSTAGITLNNLDGKTRVRDSSAGNWRTFYIYLVPRARIGEETLDLRTTLYMTEGEKDIVSELNGPQRQIRGRGGTAGVTGTGAVQEAEEVAEELSQPFGVGFAAGTSFPNFPSLSAKLFLEATLDGFADDVTGDSQGAAFSRFGFEVDSVTESGYYYPNLSFGYKWPYDTGSRQFLGAGGGAVLLNGSGLSNTFGIHGLYGITTTELFEEDIPVLLQAQIKYLNDPISETVFGVNLGVLFS